MDPERTEVRVLLRRVPFAGARVLEIGCGTGRLTRRIAGVSRSVTAIDHEEASIETAKRRQPASLRRKVRFEVRSGTALAYPAGTFDVVLLAWSL